MLRTPDCPPSNGFGYVIPIQKKSVGSLAMLRLHRLYFNAVYSTIVSHLGIESTLASCTYPDMFMEFQFEDIVFGILPRVGAELLDAFGC